MAYSPSNSPWSPAPHTVDVNGYLPSSPGEAGDRSTDSARQRRGSSPGKRAMNWFRSRSASPASINAQLPTTSDGAPPSPTSFVVRSVVKQPGGVSQTWDNHSGEILRPGQPYQKVKSRPISLGVPPGGPGGGTGYGTAQSSNDGRPEHERRQEQNERGRSRSKSPTRPPSPGAMTAGAFRGGSRSSPAQPSGLQQQRPVEAGAQHEQQHARPTPVRQQSGNTQPSGPRQSPFANSPASARMNNGTSSRQASPMASSPVAPSVSMVSAQANQNASRYSVTLPPGASMPSVIPLEGIPSPVKIPLSPRHVGASPFGSASPGSAGVFGTSQDERGGSPNVASRWFKGLFGKSPRLEERDDGVYSHEGQWMRQGGGVSPSGGPPPMVQQNASAWTDGSPLAGVRQRDTVEAEALARKKHSMAMAARIEDEHRNRAINSAAIPSQEQQHRNGHQTMLDGAALTQEPAYDPPQSRSPPGRKPPPRFTAADLEAMPQREREQVACEMDPDDKLNKLDKLEFRLTPAQQIIAETRSKMLTRGHAAEGSRILEKGKQSSVPVQIQRGFETDRRPSNGARPPTLPGKSPDGSQRKNGGQATTQQAPPTPMRANTAPAPPLAAGAAAHNGLSPGSGPMPKDMPLPSALQEMMVRFYRFERYAVPLMRSLEGRLVDVERDNQMSLNGDGMSANSAREREMDRWVGQMTGLMRHEVGQLRAATREIREARELLASVAKGQGVTTTASGFLAGRAASVVEKRMSSADAQQTAANDEQHDESDAVADLPAKAVNSKDEDPSRRSSNFSSSTFNSAIRKGPVQVAPSSSATDDAQMATSAATNASPNGRTRYTQALGRPLQGGKISPLPSPAKEREMLPFAAIPSASSPSPSEQSAASRRAVSIDDRLRALVNNSARSPSITTQGGPGGENSVHSMALSLHGGDDATSDGSVDTSFEKVTLPTPSSAAKIGDDYMLINSTSVSPTVERRQTSDHRLGPSAAAPSQHLKSASTFSTQTSTTVKPSVQRQHSTSSRALSMPASPMLPSTPLSPNSTGNKLATAITTPTRARAASPANMVPSTPSSITGAPHVSNGLRARAQSYLQNADGSAAGSGLSASSSWNTSAGGTPNKSATAASDGVDAGAAKPASTVLRSRTLNTPAGTSPTIRSTTSADEVVMKSSASQVRPLSIKKSAPSLHASRSVNGSGGNVTQGDTDDAGKNVSPAPSANDRLHTVKSARSIALSTSSSAATTPSRTSIRDRVAFFDQAQRVS